LYDRLKEVIKMEAIEKAHKQVKTFKSLKTHQGTRIIVLISFISLL